MPSLLPAWPRYAEATVINALGLLDNPNLMLEADSANLSNAYAQRAGAVDERPLREALASGLTAVNITLGHVAGEAGPFEATVRDIACWDSFIRQHARTLRKICDLSDLDAAKSQGQVGVICGFQNTLMLGQDLSRVRMFSQLGVKVIGQHRLPPNAAHMGLRGLRKPGRRAVGLGCRLHGADPWTGGRPATPSIASASATCPCLLAARRAATGWP
ncbi:MAG: membrane dipeptidase [Paucibacter sp.]|nr:membrane dipeptidase [Roseateles sp.]